MPEIVEIRIYSDFITKFIGDKIKITHNIYGNNQLELNATYHVEYVSTYGKKLFISLKRYKTQYLLVLSFSMMGKFKICDNPEPPVNASFIFTSNKLYFSFIANPDWKYKAKLDIYENMTIREYVDMKKLGPDIFDITLEQWLDVWHKRMKRSSRSLAVTLLDQFLVSGVGNYVRADMMYLAGIDPRRSIKTLSDDELILLFHNMKVVIETAYETGGMNMKDFKNPFGDEKYDCLVYGKETTRKNEPVESFELNGRKIYWCPCAQK